ncbi:glycosyltransferase family 39 protein [Blastopirellula sp. JC732]|uniref:Glycosyltransferase family 39 protein n=1 Tax=Blastopirellula sediminis TaxID=2894196 RepID=A0A9X1MRC6_9BACT|nr:glycosyltransferase family 39 protein [Blastopirellula sediminis]MCC9605735.1 glycosyltransferase family 39 protein [Blastopirellula sediminis]MCC9630965.1 glycosyltransferase family 39 protein [Blastopirellula sediminis]
MSKKSRRERTGAPAAATNDSPSEGSDLKKYAPAALLALLSFGYLLIYFQSPLPVYRGEPADRLTVLFTIFGNFTAVLGTWADLLIDPLPFLTQRTPVFLLAGLILLIATLVGRCLLSRIGLTSMLSRLENFVFASALGLAAVSLWTFAIGFAGLLHYPVVIVLPLSGLAGWGGFDWYRECASRDKAPSASEPFPWIWIAATAPIVICTLLGGMMPPYEYDVLEYHLRLPTEWLATGRIAVESYNAYSGLPMGAEMLALLPMTLWPSDQAWFYGALVGKTLICFYAPLTALAAYCAARRFTGSYAGQIAAIVVVGTPWIVFVAVYGLVDGVWAFYTVAAIFAAILWFQTKYSDQPELLPRLALLSGLMAGMATACKYPALPLLVFPLAAWILLEGWRPNFKSAITFTIGVTLLFAPWLIKNVVYTGNPVYPLAGSVFPDSIRTPEQVAQWKAAHRVPTDASGNSVTPAMLISAMKKVAYASDWTNVALTPLTIAGIVLFGLAVWKPQFLSSEDDCNPADAVAWRLALYAVYYFVVWWLFTHRYDRFLIPLAPVVALLAGYAAARTSAAGWRIVCNSLAGAGLFLCFFWINWQTSFLAPTFYFTDYQLLKEANAGPDPGILAQLVPAGKSAIVEGKADVFYMQTPIHYHTCFDASPLVGLLDKSAAERKEILKARKVSHVYVNWNEIARFRSPGNYGFAEFVTPDFFAELVAQGVLRPAKLPASQDGSPPIAPWGEFYEVIP